MKTPRMLNLIGVGKAAANKTARQRMARNGALNPDLTIPDPLKEAIEAAKTIRGVERGPALMIYGVSGRSGTVYTGELLGLHPDLFAYPNDMWETPFLELTGDILNLNKKFLRAYRKNAARFGTSDFLPLFGASFLAYLHQFAPSDKRLLVKRPKMDYLPNFFKMFPREHLLLLIRDGRDVVDSAVRSWTKTTFPKACARWNDGAKMMLAFWRAHRGQHGVYYSKYEDIFQDPAKFVKDACRCFNLDATRYPFEKINSIPVKGSSFHKKDGRVSWEATDKGNNFKPIGRWEAWPAREKETFKRIAGQSLMEAGYCSDLDW